MHSPSPPLSTSVCQHPLACHAADGVQIPLQQPTLNRKPASLSPSPSRCTCPHHFTHPPGPPQPHTHTPRPQTHHEVCKFLVACLPVLHAVVAHTPPPPPAPANPPHSLPAFCSMSSSHSHCCLPSPPALPCPPPPPPSHTPRGFVSTPCPYKRSPRSLPASRSMSPSPSRCTCAHHHKQRGQILTVNQLTRLHQAADVTHCKAAACFAQRRTDLTLDGVEFTQLHLTMGGGVRMGKGEWGRGGAGGGVGG